MVSFSKSSSFGRVSSGGIEIVYLQRVFWPITGSARGVKIVGLGIHLSLAWIVGEPWCWKMEQPLRKILLLGLTVLMYIWTETPKYIQNANSRSILVARGCADHRRGSGTKYPSPKKHLSISYSNRDLVKQWSDKATFSGGGPDPKCCRVGRQAYRLVSLPKVSPPFESPPLYSAIRPIGTHISHYLSAK